MEDKINDNEVIRTFNNQVAGHKHNLLKSGSVGLVKFGDDCILKPITKPRQGHTEITFYQDIWSSPDSIIGLLKLFVPKYHGIVTLKLDGKDTTFLRLQDLSADLKKPCIIDVKIGAQTWEPNVDFEKQCTEDLKYAETKEAYGISITGYQVFKIDTGELIRRDKEFGKSLKRETVPQALKEFFNVKTEGSDIVLKHVLNRLYDILSWWRQQSLVNIYGSSVLMLYDAWELEYLYKPKEMELCEEQTNTTIRLMSGQDHVPNYPLEGSTISTFPQTTSEPASATVNMSTQTPLQNPPDEVKRSVDRLYMNMMNIPWIRVYMIDFAHVVYPYSPKPDQNYINGLTNLIKLIENL